MNRRETAEEPSMEDILASIRKIISDESVATAAPTLPLPKLSPVGFSPAAKDAPRSFAAPQTTPEKSPATQQPSLTARLNDVFGPGTIVPGDNNQHTPRPMPVSRPVRSVMDDDLGDMLADAPPAPFKPANQPAAAARPAPTVIAEPPARSRSLPLDNTSTDLLSGRSSIPAPPSGPGGDTSRFPSQSALNDTASYPPNARLTELRTNPQAAPALFNTAPAHPIPPETNRPAPVVIASMASANPRPLPEARPFNFAPGGSPAAAAPLATSPATSEAPAKRPEPADLVSSDPYLVPPATAATVSFTPAPAPVVTPAAQPSVAATIAQPASNPAAPPAGISASTLDFLLPSSRQPAPDAPVAAKIDVTTSSLDFLMPSPQLFDDQPVEIAPIAAMPPVAEVELPSPVEPASPVETAPPVAPFIAAEPVATAPEPAIAPPIAEPAAEDPSVAVASALGALAAGLAASSRESIPEMVASAVEVSPAQIESVPPEPTGASTSVATSTGLSVFSSPDNFVGGAQLKPISTSTLDDTAAELLRPMLRQWLDANMPRIVERALRIELTDAVTVPVKTEPEK